MTELNPADVLANAHKDFVRALQCDVHPDTTNARMMDWFDEHAGLVLDALRAALQEQSK